MTKTDSKQLLHACLLSSIYLPVSPFFLSALIFYRIVILARCLFCTFRSLLPPSLNGRITYSFINTTSEVLFRALWIAEEPCWDVPFLVCKCCLPLCLYCRSRWVCVALGRHTQNFCLSPLHWKWSSMSVSDAPSAPKVSSTRNVLADKTHDSQPIVKWWNLRLTCLGKNTALLDKNLLESFRNNYQDINVVGTKTVGNVILN